MSKGWSKAYIGLGAAFVLLGAVSLGIGLGIWSTWIGYILGGMLFILSGITSIIGVWDKKIIRGLRFGLAGVAIGFIVVGLVLLIRS
jgi:hypothetical protein